MEEEKTKSDLMCETSRGRRKVLPELLEAHLNCFNFTVASQSIQHLQPNDSFKEAVRPLSSAARLQTGL